MNTCNKCRSVKYCNAACKKKHRTKHKKACERRVAELHDEALFKDHPPREECPICFLPLPLENDQSLFKCCCGKSICCGCIYAMKVSEGGKDICPFCRESPITTYQEENNKICGFMEKGNLHAFHLLGCRYTMGTKGLPRDYQKANKLLLKGGEIGCAAACYSLGCSYELGRGVERDMKKAIYYWELSAIGGCLEARHELGVLEEQAGNNHRALEHCIIAARAGRRESLDVVKQAFTFGAFTKDEYADILRVYLEKQKELKSNMRDKAKEIGYGQTGERNTPKVSRLLLLP